jgi:hypothetical protein
LPNPKTAIQNRHYPKILIFVGFIVLVAGILLFKNQPDEQKNQVVSNETPEQQLDRLLESGELVFAFIHSTNCQSCIDMMQTVDLVYPEYKDTIALIDVDVYDPINQSLLKRANVSYIPTQIFIDLTGEGKISVGAMSPDDLRSALNELLEKK